MTNEQNTVPDPFQELFPPKKRKKKTRQARQQEEQPPDKTHRVRFDQQSTKALLLVTYPQVSSHSANHPNAKSSETKRRFANADPAYA